MIKKRKNLKIALKYFSRVLYIPPIAAIFLLFFASRCIFLHSKVSIKWLSSIELLFCSFAILLIGVLFTNRNVYDFKSNLNNNGLKVAIFNEIFKNDITNIIQYESAEVATESEIGTDTNDTVSEKSEMYDKNIYNVENIDFDAVINKEDRYEFNQISEFLKNRKPTKKTNILAFLKERIL